MNCMSLCSSTSIPNLIAQNEFLCGGIENIKINNKETENQLANLINKKQETQELLAYLIKKHLDISILINNSKEKIESYKEKQRILSRELESLEEESALFENLLINSKNILQTSIKKSDKLIYDTYLLNEKQRNLIEKESKT